MVAFFFSFAQEQFFTKTAKITFTSKAPLEDIEAVNKTTAALLNTTTGALQFSVLLKGFQFPKALMQEHFNDSYVESDRYPSANFKGTITNNSAITYTKNGTYTARVKGLLTLHGVTKPVQTSGILTIAGNQMEATANFRILLSDFNIKIPPAVKEKVSNSVSIAVDARLEPLKNGLSLN